MLAAVLRYIENSSLFEFSNKRLVGADNFYLVQDKWFHRCYCYCHFMNDAKIIWRVNLRKSLSKDLTLLLIAREISVFLIDSRGGFSLKPTRVFDSQGFAANKFVVNPLLLCSAHNVHIVNMLTMKLRASSIKPRPCSPIEVEGMKCKRSGGFKDLFA